MKEEVAYCTGCGHQVRLIFTDPPPRSGQANLRDNAEIVCLEYHEDCAGGKCPTTGKAGIVMGVRLARSHLNDDAFTTVHARCEGCGQIADLGVLDDTFAICPLCDTTNRWVMLRLPDDTDVTVTGP